MDASLSVTPTGFPALAFVTPVTARRSAAGTLPAAVNPDNGSSVVELSDTGTLLSSIFAFEGDLETLRTDASVTPDNVLGRARGLVDAFNALQENIAALPRPLLASGETTTASSLSRTLNTLLTDAVVNDSADSGTLGSIGITLRAGASASGTGVVLGIDQDVLARAVATDAPGASAILDRTTRSLLDRTALFETQAANALAVEAGLPPASTVLDVNTDTTLSRSDVGDSSLTQTRNLTAQLTDAAAPAATAANAIAAQPAPLAIPNNPPNANALNAARVASAADGATLPIPTLVVGPAPTAGNPAAGTAGAANATDREAFAARLALQALIDNPLGRSLDMAFDPAYSAVMAATHPSDFVLPTPTFNAQGLPDTVQPIVAISALDRIAAYGDTGGEPRRRINTIA